VCVGYGAFWRFPNLVYRNGGGVFLIPYLIAMALMGMPLLYLETALGQMHRVSIPFAFSRIHPCLKIIGLGVMTATFHFSTGYNIILGYCYRFMFTVFQYPLPFADEAITENTYFHKDILQQSASINDYGGIVPSLFFLYIVSIVLCHFIIKEGAKTSGKVVVITATAPYVIFIILVLRGLFLEGAMDGIIFLFKPKW
jgi:SNF family Na+-dependent transporter